MKDLSKYLLEGMTSISAFFLPRVSMPQIKDVSAFKKFLEEKSIPFKEAFIDPSNIRPTQSDFDEDKVESILRKINNGELSSSVIIVSKTKNQDAYALDGHHRYLASKEAGVEVKALIVDISLNKLLALAYDYNKETL